jgi:hypothetical protein
MKMLAYECANFVPIAVPLFCKTCSPLNVKLLCFSTKVSNWTRHSVGGSLTALWPQASQHASIPSLCGILVYNDVTSIETRMVPEGRFKDNQWCLSNVRVALLHEVEGGHPRIRRFYSVGCSFAEAMGLPGLLTL